MDIGILMVTVAAFSVSLVVTGLMRSYALQHDFLDVPNLRSSHTAPTPRGGGVAIVLAFLASVLVLVLLGKIDTGVVLALIAGGGITALVGFIDDRRPQSAGVRFAVHLVAAGSALILIGGIAGRAFVNLGVHSIWVGWLLALATLVWATNLFNFMDGIDGIAASEAVFIAGAGAGFNWYYGGEAGLTAVMLCLAAASLGFLHWNWPPARIFMGDVGSGFLGFSIAVLGIAQARTAIIPIEVWGILGGVFLVDATATLLRRIARGDRWFQAHRMHAYQHLARRWRAHLPVTTLVILINVVWLLPVAMLAARFPMRAPWFLAAALIPLVVLAYGCGAGAQE
jgi:Fuc2NAc and GlcNAc transferase